MNENVICVKHCWHDTSTLLTSNPPQSVLICCWCGVEKSIRAENYGLLGAMSQHGAYVPQPYSRFAPKVGAGK